jgi:hypothetical protein
VSVLSWIFSRKKQRPGKDPTPTVVAKGKRSPVHEFGARLTGVDLENQDGSFRQEIIARTEPGAETIFVAQMGALKLVAVFLAETGEQLGFLNRETSGKIIKEAKGYDYGSRVAEIHEPEAESSIRNVTLTIEVFEKPRRR